MSILRRLTGRTVPPEPMPAPARIEITLADLTRAKRREIIADRKARTTAALRRAVASGFVALMEERR